MVFEFLPKVLIEFIWLLFSVGMGMAIVAGVTNTDLEPILDVYAVPIAMVIFNAAASRYVIAYALDRIDKNLDRINAEQAAEVEMIKTGIKAWLRILIGSRAPEEHDENPIE
jgi:hypothetical protein